MGWNIRKILPHLRKMIEDTINIIIYSSTILKNLFRD